MQFSPADGSQTLLPHSLGHTPQSGWQLEHDSPLLLSQTLSPQTGGHCPQSDVQVLQVSPELFSQTLLPHKLMQPPQSAAHEEQDSVGSQTPLPQVNTCIPQSSAQLAGVSPSAESHTPSPQTVRHAPQSRGQLVQESRLVQAPSPQYSGRGGIPQSAGQLTLFSPSKGWQLPSSLQVPCGTKGLPTSGQEAKVTDEPKGVWEL